MRFGAVDCEAYSDTLCATHKIAKFPTLCGFLSLPGGSQRPSGECLEPTTSVHNREMIENWVNKLMKQAGINANGGGGGGGVTPTSKKSLVPAGRITTADLAATCFFGLQQGLDPSTQTLVPGSTRALAMAGWLRLLQKLLRPMGERGEKPPGAVVNPNPLLRLAENLESVDNPNGVNTLTRAVWRREVGKLSFWAHQSGVAWEVCGGQGHGYPCGLWQLFHTLTLASADMEARATLETIRGYVAHFFECGPCQEHFEADL